MTSMNSAKLFLQAFLIASLAGAMAARAADQPTIDSILAKHVEAIGGKAAIEKVSSRVMKFTLESDTLGNSKGEIYATSPNKQRTHIELGDGGVIDEGFDGQVAWSKNPWQGLRDKTGEELAKVKRDADIHRDLHLKSIYPDLAYKGTEKVGDEEAYVLESKPTAASKEKFWFSTRTGLALRQDSDFEGPQGKIGLSLLLSDYKTFSGLKYPGALKFKISTGDQDINFVMKITDAQHNVPIDSAKFTKPAE
jgi:outer membrane lipoprotein-sorting protein